MKRYFLTTMLILMTLSMSLSACASTSTQIDATNDILILLQIDNPKMLSNGVEKNIDESGTVPLVDNGRTLVPIRAIIEECGGTVEWNQNTQSVILNYNSDEIILGINSTTAYLNGDVEELDVAPQIINERTMLPIRFIAEKFNFNVLWNENYSVITITNNSENNNTDIPEKWKIKTSKDVTENPDNNEALDQNLKVHFIDVGQGDAIFIELPNKETMLIDAGPSQGIVANYIKGYGYNYINYVVATHPDADHITGMPEVLNTFSVDKFYMPEKEHTTNIFESMLDAVSNNGCDAVYALAGKQIVNTNELHVYFVGPVKIYSDNNDCSAVVKIEYKQNSFLFTGDAETTSENDMIASGYDLSADILKVGHHGSSSSTSASFINVVNPKEAIISVGADNKYGHPTTEVLTILNNAGINIYRTDEVGTIVVASDGVNYSIDKLKSTVEANAPPETKSEVQQEANYVEQNNSGNGSEIVYITSTGSKYHSEGCSYLKSAIQTTVAEAKNKGLTPCSRCDPPQ